MHELHVSSWAAEAQPWEVWPWSWNFLWPNYYISTHHSLHIWLTSSFLWSLTAACQLHCYGGGEKYMRNGKDSRILQNGLLYEPWLLLQVLVCPVLVTPDLESLDVHIPKMWASEDSKADIPETIGHFSFYSLISCFSCTFLCLSRKKKCCLC